MGAQSFACKFMRGLNLFSIQSDDLFLGLYIDIDEKIEFTSLRA